MEINLFKSEILMKEKTFIFFEGLFGTSHMGFSIFHYIYNITVIFSFKIETSLQELN